VTDLRRFFHRTAALFRFARAEADLAREIDAHLQLLEDRFVENGMTREDARCAARRAFGGVDQAKELHRDERSFRWLTGWPMDLRLGVRMLVKSPGLTAVAVVALAVAIGAGSAYLEFMRDLTSPTLPIAGAGRIVGIRLFDTGARAPQTRALHDFDLWRRNASTIEPFGAARELARYQMAADGRTEPWRGVEITASAFRLVPTPTLLGRTLVEEDERPGAEPVAVIGQDLWQTRFQSDPNVTGRTLRLGSAVHTIVGVMPAKFGFPANHNLWAPLKVQAAGVKRGEGPSILIFGRLKEGVSVEAAQAELQGLLNADAISPPDAASPHTRATLRADVRLYLDSLLAEDRESYEATVLYAANLVFLMLLAICSANVATLVFARTAMREAEITVRSALGASRGRISAQLFAEALVLSCVGALAGLAVAAFVGLWAKHLLIQATGRPRPFWWDDGFSPQTLLYAALLAVFAALIVGVIPALKATGPQLHSRLREASAAGSGMKFGRLWTGVIVTQTAITVLVLATVASLGWAAIRGQYGFDVTYACEQFLTARLLQGESSAVAKEPRSTGADTLHAIASGLQAEPGVINTTYATAVPGITRELSSLEFATPPRDPSAQPVTKMAWTQAARVGVNFFQTLGIPLVSGRLFTDAEILAGNNVAIVDETFVRIILGGCNPLGLMVRQPPSEAGGKPEAWHEIIGVVRDVTIRTHKRRVDAVLYRPAGPSAAASRMRLLVRTQGAASPMAHRLHSAALSVSPQLRLIDLMSMDRLAHEETLPTRFFLRVFAVIAAVALLLSTAGIYSLISFTLARRTREIGIRVALGAAPRRIIVSVFSRAFTQFALGVLAGAIPATAIMAKGAEDSAGLGFAAAVSGTASVCAFVILVALLSCFVPLRRALRIDPMQALRADS
jgi:predicted permease